MASREGADQGVPGPGPEAGAAGREIASILVQGEGTGIGNRLANAAESEIAPVSFSKRAPALSPFFRSVRPLPNSGADGFSDQRDGTYGAEHELTETLRAAGLCGGRGLYNG